jgi:hypothetical protein
VGRGREQNLHGKTLMHVFRHWLLCSIGIQADISLYTEYTELAANAFLERPAVNTDRHQIELFEEEHGTG